MGIQLGTITSSPIVMRRNDRTNHKQSCNIRKCLKAQTCHLSIKAPRNVSQDHNKDFKQRFQATLITIPKYMIH